MHLGVCLFFYYSSSCVHINYVVIYGSPFRPLKKDRIHNSTFQVIFSKFWLTFPQNFGLISRNFEKKTWNFKLWILFYFFFFSGRNELPYLLNKPKRKKRKGKRGNIQQKRHLIFFYDYYKQVNYFFKIVNLCYFYCNAFKRKCIIISEFVLN